MIGMSFDTVPREVDGVGPQRVRRGGIEEAGLARKLPGVALEVSSAVGSIASAQPQPAWPVKLLPLPWKLRPSRSV